MEGLQDKIVETIGLVNHVWLATLADEQTKKQIGLNHVSHMWDQDRPYWYLWFDDCPGVYKMELLGSRPITGYDWLATFALKYYPAETEPSFDKLSTLEKLCRTSEMFHSLPSYGVCDCPCQGLHPGHGHKIHSSKNTGAPDIAFHDIIPSGFFYTGDVRIAFSERSGSVIRLESQTSWKTILQNDFTLRDDAGGILAQLKEGQADKDYPGLAVSNLLYRRLVASWSCVHQYALESESVRETEGSVSLSDGYAATSAPSGEVKRTIIQSELRRNPSDRLEPAHWDDHPLMGKDSLSECKESKI